MNDLVTRLRAEDVNEPIERLLDEAANRIADLELALVELSRTDGSPRNVASTELLASRVRVTARRALGGSAPRRPQPTPDKINGAGHGAMRSSPRLPPRRSNVKCPGLAAQPSPPAGIMSQRICIASAFVAFAGMSGISGTLAASRA